MKTFVEKLAAASAANRSLLCVGLDPDPQLMAVRDVAAFNREIVDATRDLVCAYKPNLPFYEALGREGFDALERTIDHIRDAAPDVVLVGDSKRGDIDSTNALYARALFDVWGFDAATVNAYAGGDSLEPFLDYADRGVIVWCRSSNPGADDFQDLRSADDGGMPLYELMAKRASGWNTRGNVGLVVGATYPREIAAVRAHCPGMPLLVPGVGAQGGDLEQSVRFGLDGDRPNLMISSSRGVTYASRCAGDFAEAARAAASRLRDDINAVLAREGAEWC